LDLLEDQQGRTWIGESIGFLSA